MSFPLPKQVDKRELGEDGIDALHAYIEDKVHDLKLKCRGIREDLMPKWTRIYRGVPAEKEKTWPWPGASNLVIQLVGTYSDELLSRIMSMYATDPLFYANVLGDYEAGVGADYAEMLAGFLQDCAYEPSELDLYRVEEQGFSSAIRFGTGVFCFPWQYVAEKAYVYISGGLSHSEPVQYTMGDLVVKDGPAPATVPLADWSIDPKFANLALADFKIRTLHYDFYQLSNLKAHPEIYDRDALDTVLGSQDKYPEYRQQLEEQKQIQKVDGKSGINYDIEECWFTYQHNDQIFNLIAYYHEGSNTHLGCIYNPYPDNEEPFEDAKLAYDDDTYFGYGFAEMLEAYQREISTTHNWRIDNRHFATTGVGRVNKNSKLASIVQLFPGVLIPADEGEIEALQFGQGATAMGTEDEAFTWQLTTARAGVDPATGGQGGGTVNAKKGVYSAQNTAMSLQSTNNRNNLRMSDMRSCHVRIGRKLLRMYSHFGISSKIRKYGNRAELLKKALADYKAGKLGLLIKPATASQNRELERQNEILLSSTLERMYQTDMGLVQALITPGQNPMQIDYIKKILVAKNSMYKTLLRSFGKEDVERLIPVPSFMVEERQNALNASTANAGNTQRPQGQQSGFEGMVPVGAGPNLGQIPGVQ